MVSVADELHTAISVADELHTAIDSGETLLQALVARPHAISDLDTAAVTALYAHEARKFGGVSDLGALPRCPRRWQWMSWEDSAPACAAAACRGRLVRVTRLRPEPRVASLAGFLSADEAAHIVELARPLLKRSRVINHAAEGDVGELSDARTSESCRVPAARDAVVRRAVQRAAFLAGLTPWHAEAVQVVRYLPGQQYRPHHDYFDPSDARYAEKCDDRGNRLLSFFVYLSGCAGGGRTAFPELRLAFEPEVGAAVVWYNIDREGALDGRTLHAGEPVVSGEKWGMNIWLRQRAPRRARPAVRATVEIAGPAAARVRIAAEESAAETRCAKCGDRVAPALGLCLCRGQYV